MSNVKYKVGEKYYIKLGGDSTDLYEIEITGMSNKTVEVQDTINDIRTTKSRFKWEDVEFVEQIK